MLDIKKMEGTLALLADETAKLAAESAQPNRESKWHPSAVIGAAAGAGAALMGTLTGAAVLILKQLG